jgi:dolichyl-phosphate-mannose--protein O-mannosyl transferase
MTGIFKDPLLPLFGKGKKWYLWHAWTALALDFLGAACLVVGIIAAALDRELGLAPTYWILIAIAFWVGGLWSYLCARNTGKE